MKLSKRARYGTLALVDLALHAGKRPVKLEDIAARQQISLRYLAQLVRPLVVGGVIKTVRGPTGGIMLARGAESINLSEVITLLEGSLAFVKCVDDPQTCPRSPSCVTRGAWVKITAGFDGMLRSTSLKDLAEECKKVDCM